jgi:Signal transduction histidine kinase
MDKIIIVTTCVIICVMVIIFCRRYVRNTFNQIDDMLDGMLKSDAFSETRISKLNHKLGRIMEMYSANSKKAVSETTTIQGFISDMSHQMKTPLAGISMYSTLLSEGNLSDDEQREFLSRITSSTEKLQWMMDCLIKMSRLEVGAIQLQPVNAFIRKTIAESIESVLSAADNKNITISVNDFADIELYHDRRWTREALVNILENAVKYSHDGGNVEISVESQASNLYTKVTVTDYGIGIDKSEWNNIFKRFYRASNAENVAGTGLGLYLASLVMEKQGGYIMVDSRTSGKIYTSFSVFLQNCKN